MKENEVCGVVSPLNCGPNKPKMAQVYLLEGKYKWMRFLIYSTYSPLGQRRKMTVMRGTQRQANPVTQAAVATNTSLQLS